MVHFIINFITHFIENTSNLFRTSRKSLHDYRIHSKGKGPHKELIVQASCLAVRLAPSLCFSYSTRLDIHEIFMNPPDGWETYHLMKHFCQHQTVGKKSFSPHVVPKTKGLDESLPCSCFHLKFIPTFETVFAETRKLIEGCKCLILNFYIG